MIDLLYLTGAIPGLAVLLLLALYYGEDERQRLHSRRCALIRLYREVN